MNTMWMRLSIAFSSVVLLSMLALVLLTVILTEMGALQYLFLDEIEQEGGLLDQLRGYYDENGSWTGVELLAAELMSAYAIAGNSPKLYLTDRNDDLVYATFYDAVLRYRDTARPLADYSVVVDGETVGYLRIGIMPGGRDPFLVQRVGRFMVLMAIIAGSVGIVAAILMSRNMTKPLARLVEAARAFAERRFSHRVVVQGSQEVIELANALNDMAAALERAEVQRRNLVGDVAHELRTPLSVIQGNLQAILDDVYPLSKEELARLYDQTRVLSRLVNELHELSQAEARQLPLNIKPVDVSHVIRTTVDVFHPLAESEGVLIDMQIAPHLPRIDADSGRLTQILHNLLSNALRHTPRGGIIHLCAEQIGDRLHLSVSDTGEGIPAEHLPYVFDRFYRVDRNRSRATGGAGLGLAIVKAIVEAHGGSISASSEGVSGRGSTFHVYLPAATAA